MTTGWSRIIARVRGSRQICRNSLRITGQIREGIVSSCRMIPDVSGDLRSIRKRGLGLQAIEEEPGQFVADLLHRVAQQTALLV